MRSASTPSQRRLSQAAMFVGSKDGEFEVGMLSTAGKINMQMGIRNTFTEEFARQSSQFGELFHPDQSCPSSSSSSLRSLSAGSPEYSSLILSNTTSTSSPRMPDSSLREVSIEQVITTQRRSAYDLVPPHQATVQANAQIRRTQVPAPTSDVDAAMARAMLAVISSSSPGQDQLARRPWGAFRPYDSAPPAPKIEAIQVSQGQRMMKRAFAVLRQIKVPVESSPRLGSNQWNHVMSERKRREKLNESFAALRESLPPGTKRDKASVLARTIDFVNSLKAEISELEGKNRFMEARLLPRAPDETDVEDDAPGKSAVRIKIERGPRSSSGWQQIELRVIARVEYCDMIDLVLHMLECLKRMRGVKLVSLDASVHARQLNPVRRAIITVQIKGSDWDEDSFKGAIASAAEEASRRRPET